ncbi:hypothetical protein DRW07_12340 [Alteromonas sediminis]|uniref:Uncharacterized protein n=1 Tax=Alteromonas sediminis TaxID=2259342 RepID=A0A3N5Y5S2_9ALTE|nr:hypothetical protein [Alteromonas sediminis]RPJ65609.1 hypothetical protein DRW07_12340 [Alteromonas sediminis]
MGKLQQAIAFVVCGSIVFGLLFGRRFTQNLTVSDRFSIDNKGKVMRRSDAPFEASVLIPGRSKVSPWVLYLSIEHPATKVSSGMWILKGSVSDRSFRRLSRIIRTLSTHF